MGYLAKQIHSSSQIYAFGMSNVQVTAEFSGPPNPNPRAMVKESLVAQLDTESELWAGSRGCEAVIHPCGPSTDRSRAPLTARWGSRQGWPSRRGSLARRRRY